MIEQVTFKGFKALEHLELTSLVQSKGGTIKFSDSRPNILIGPNGSGKSTLIIALAMRFMAYMTGNSCVTVDDPKVEKGRAKVWGGEKSWEDAKFMPGMDVATDNGAALYYRPGHIPGQEDNVVTAMMVGFWEEAREYARLTENKSSGQQCSARLDSVLKALRGEVSDIKYRGTKLVAQKNTEKHPYQGLTKHEVIRDIVTRGKTGKPVLLLDEPEQSLDALAHLKLWHALENARTDKVQVIAATHSIYPLTRPDKFNIIETQPGYLAQALQAVQSTEAT